MAIDGDSRLFKRGIRSISGQKVPNGLTYGNAPTMAHNCILPDFSLVWIVTLYDYYKQTGDLSLFVEQIPRVKEILSYFKEEAPTINGFIAYDPRYWLFLDWCSIQKEGASTLYNMWYLMALETLTQLYKLAGFEKESEELKVESIKLRNKIEEKLFDEQEGLFADGLDSNGQLSEVHSVHSQTLAIILGLKSKFHDNMLEKRILPYLNGEELNVPLPSAYWSSYVLTVAREKGYTNEALDFIKRMWTPMIPYSTTFETFDMSSEIFTVSHAWSAHPVFHLMNMLGGVIQDEVNWNSIIYKPFFDPQLNYVKIKYPTPHGLIESKWERKADSIEVILKLPQNISAKIEIPGYESEINEMFHYIIKV